MTLGELDDLLCNESQMAHVTKSDPLHLLHFIIAPLASIDLLRNPSSFEKVDSQYSVASTVHRSIEYLLNDIVNDVMKEVVPRETEKEVL